MSHPHTFEHTSVLPAPLEKIWAFHEQPNAFGILTPPPIFVQVHRREMVSLRQGEIEFTLWFAFFPIRWLALHEPGSTPTSFVDRMLRGPLKTWRHEHRLEATPNGTRLTDQITIEHHDGWRGVLTRLMFDGLALRMLFVYRHLQTRLRTRG